MQQRDPTKQLQQTMVPLVLRERDSIFFFYFLFLKIVFYFLKSDVSSHFSSFQRTTTYLLLIEIT